MQHCNFEETEIGDVRNSVLVDCFVLLIECQLQVSGRGTRFVPLGDDVQHQVSSHVVGEGTSTQC